jgi:cytidylate kinase
MSLITISRGIGCGGLIIARQVAEALDLDLFDDQRLQEEALRLGIRSKDLVSLDEKKPGLFDRILNRRPELYLDFMEAVVYGVAQGGRGVILGHGSQMLLRDFGCALHVHVHAHEAARVRNLMAHKGLSREAAEKLIRQSDARQRGFFQYAFHMDWKDPGLYDLIINTEQIGIDLAAKLITEAARSETMQACSLTAVTAMERLSLKKKIEGFLLEKDINTATLLIEVPEPGVAEVTGLAYSAEEKARIDAVLKSIPGLTELRGSVNIMPTAL